MNAERGSVPSDDAIKLRQVDVESTFQVADGRIKRSTAPILSRTLVSQPGMVHRLKSYDEEDGMKQVGYGSYDELSSTAFVAPYPLYSAGPTDGSNTSMGNSTRLSQNTVF